MSSTIDKSKIIEALNDTDDERILFAINRLLQIDEDIPAWHKEILQERIENEENGKSTFQKWNDIKDSVFKK